MQIIDFYNSTNQNHWLDEIKKSDWEAGQYLYGLLQRKELKALCGDSTRVLLLVDKDNLLSFCIYAEQDDVREPLLTPWVGFVYTFPEYRGKRRMGKLLEYAYNLAKNEGYRSIYISTGETGLYEKYGYSYWKMMKNINGEDSRVYRNEIAAKDYSDIIGKTVSGTIDRPPGTAHPRYPEMIYPLNYGYVDGIMSGDGTRQDVYVFGTDKPTETFSGEVIAVYHRLNDCEDKWIVSINGIKPSKEEILRSIDFQEQYFMGELYL